MWKGSFGVRRPSKSESWRCENEALVRDFLQEVKVEDVKTKLWCETSFKNQQLQVGKMSPEAAVPQRGGSWSDRACFKTAGRKSFPTHLPGHVLSCKTQHFVHPLTFKNAFRARLHSKSESGRCEEAAFVRDVPPNSDSWRCDHEAFVRDVPQNLKVADVKTRLSCETSLKIWKGKMWKRSFRKRPPSKSESGRCKKDAFVRETSLKIWKGKMWKRRFRKRPPSKSGRCEKDAFVRETSPKIWKWKMWKRGFRARRPSKSGSGRCENEALVRDIPQNLNVEGVKAFVPDFFALTSLCFSHPFALASLCSDIPLLWHPFALTPLCSDIPLLWHSFALTSLCSEIPLLWHPFALTSLCHDIPLLWHPFALTSLCLDIPLLWHLFAPTSLCFDIPLLWHLFALTSLCSDIPLLRNPFALTFICFNIRVLCFSNVRYREV